MWEVIMDLISDYISIHTVPSHSLKISSPIPPPPPPPAVSWCNQPDRNRPHYLSLACTQHPPPPPSLSPSPPPPPPPLSHTSSSSFPSSLSSSSSFCFTSFYLPRHSTNWVALTFPFNIPFFKVHNLLWLFVKHLTVSFHYPFLVPVHWSVSPVFCVKYQMATLVPNVPTIPLKPLYNPCDHCVLNTVHCTIWTIKCSLHYVHPHGSLEEEKNKKNTLHISHFLGNYPRSSGFLVKCWILFI